MIYSKRMRSALRNIAVVLVRTKHPANIGSVARAMHNMGLADLRLADPRCLIDEESHRLARAGSPVLETARRFRSVQTALRGLHLIVGTSAKTGGHREKALTPRQAAAAIVAQAARQKVGIIFGPEDTGLVDHDLLRCHLLFRIPTQPDARSLNLAQAVLVVAYELYLASRLRQPERVVKLAPVQQVEAMYTQFEEALLEIGFLHSQNARHIMFALRRMLGRAGLEKDDVGMLRGIARQIDWYAGMVKKWKAQVGNRESE
jgi:tRNA/rRNA methyltransferase